MKRRFIKVFSIFFITIYIWVNLLSSPSYAFSTVDRCMNQPKCAGAFVQSSGLKGKLATNSTEVVKSVVKFRKIDKVTGSVLGTSSSSITKYIAALFGVGAGSVLYTSLTERQADELRDKALDNYCAANPDDSNVCFYELIILINSQAISVSNSGNSMTIDFKDPDADPLIASYRPNPRDPRYPGTLYGFDSFRLVDGRYYGYIYERYEWEDIDGNKREKIINDYLPDQQIHDYLDSHVTAQDMPFAASDGELVEVYSPIITDGSTVYDDGVWLPVPSDGPDLEDDRQQDTPVNGSDSGGSGTDTGSGGGTGDGSGTSTEQGTTDLQQEEEEEPVLETPLVVPDIEPIAEAEFNAVNFVQHAVNVFSNKFPFDVWGDFNYADIAADCPQYVFFDLQFELCPIRDLFVAFKYPVIIGFLVKIYHSL